MSRDEQSPRRDGGEDRRRNDEPRETTDKRSIYVGRLGDRVDEDELRKLFGEFGPVEDVRFGWKDKINRIHKGFAFIQFANEDDAKAAASKTHTIDGQELKISMAGEGSKRNSVFVGNLAYSVTQDALLKLFGECGKIVKCNMPLKEDGSIVGYAFIDFESMDEVDRAVRLSDTDLEGRRIRVEEGNKKKGGDRGGFRGRGGDRYGGDRDGRRDDRYGGGDRYGGRRDDRGGDRGYGRSRDERRDDRGSGGYERREERRDDRSGGDRYERRDRY